MARFLKTSLLLILIVGLTWLAVIVWWQDGGKEPSEWEMLAYLVLLPLMLLAAALGLNHWRASRAKAREASAENDAAPVPVNDEKSLPPELQVHSVALIGAPGDSAAAVQAALLAQQRPALDPTLRDGEGLPVFSARVPGLDNAALRRDAGRDAHAIDDTALRATALLVQAIGALAESTAQTAPAQIILHVILPGSWTEPERERAARLARAAWSGRDVQTHRHLDTDAGSTLAVLRQIAARPVAPDTWVAVAACDSHVTRATLQRWERRDALFRHAAPQGKLPGEAAAALVLGPTANDATARLVLADDALRDVPSDAATAGGDKTLEHLATRFLADIAIEAKDIVRVVSDADHRGSRQSESYALLANHARPGLEPVAGCLLTGMGCGYVGATAALSTLAVAVQACKDEQAPVLAAFTQADRLRQLALVRPVAEPVAA